MTLTRTQIFVTSLDENSSINFSKSLDGFPPFALVGIQVKRMQYISAFPEIVLDVEFFNINITTFSNLFSRKQTINSSCRLVPRLSILKLDRFSKIENLKHSNSIIIILARRNFFDVCTIYFCIILFVLLTYFCKYVNKNMYFLISKFVVSN